MNDHDTQFKQFMHTHASDMSLNDFNGHTSQQMIDECLTLDNDSCVGKSIYELMNIAIECINENKQHEFYKRIMNIDQSDNDSYDDDVSNEIIYECICEREHDLQSNRDIAIAIMDQSIMYMYA